MKFILSVSLLSLILLLPTSFALAQNNRASSEIDRIQKEVSAYPDNKEKIELLYRSSRLLRKIAPKVALGYANQAVALANKYKHNQGMAYSFLGARYINLERYTESVKAYEQAVKFNAGDAYARIRGKNYESLGHSHTKLNNYPKAVENYKKYLWVVSKLKDKQEMAVAHNKLGEVYFKQGNFSEALKSFKSALTLSKELGNQSDINSLQRNIATCEGLLNNGSSTSNLKNAKIEALEYQEKYEITRDSLQDARQLVQETSAELKLREVQLGEKEAELEQKEQDIMSLEEAKELIESEAERQQQLFLIVISAAAGFLITMAIIALLIQRNYRIKKRANRDLEAANRDLEIKNKEVEEEKKKSEELLLNILPGEVARELIDNGRVEPRKYKQATMLFTDFKGFTKIAENIPPEALIKELNSCFEAFDEICEKHQLEKIKTIGDAYMAAGGIPSPNDTHPHDVVHAALEMQAFMKNWKTEKELRGEPFWELRIGVHTGPVIAGVIGKNKFAYDIWGDAVNVASRMESSGQAWMINISKQTFDYVRRDFACTHRGQIPIKNKGPVDMYFVEPKIA